MFVTFVILGLVSGAAMSQNYDGLRPCIYQGYYDSQIEYPGVKKQYQARMMDDLMEDKRGGAKESLEDAWNPEAIFGERDIPPPEGKPTGPKPNYLPPTDIPKGELLENTSNINKKRYLSNKLNTRQEIARNLGILEKNRYLMEKVNKLFSQP